jgi:hypothetical protein
MKKTITIALMAIMSFSAKAQQPKQDSLVLQITMDTTTFKNVVQLIQENINGQSATGKVLLQNILSPLYQFKLVPREAVKPKELPKIEPDKKKN